MMHDPPDRQLHQRPARRYLTVPARAGLGTHAGCRGNGTHRPSRPNTTAHRHRARVALVGDRHQLSAVGRGGALDVARRWAEPAATVDLDVVDRFTRETLTADGKPTRVPDPGYAALTLRMRDGRDPADVFDDLHTRGLVRLFDREYDRQQAIADEVVCARRGQRTVAVVVDTREQAAALNNAIRDRLIAGGLVDDRRAASTRAGQPVGAGDVIATRRNDHALDVANRGHLDRHARAW